MDEYLGERPVRGRTVAVAALRAALVCTGLGLALPMTYAEEVRFTDSSASAPKEEVVARIKAPQAEPIITRQPNAIGSHSSLSVGRSYGSEQAATKIVAWPQYSDYSKLAEQPEASPAEANVVPQSLVTNSSSGTMQVRMPGSMPPMQTAQPLVAPAAPPAVAQIQAAAPPAAIATPVVRPAYAQPLAEQQNVAQVATPSWPTQTPSQAPSNSAPSVATPIAAAPLPAAPMEAAPAVPAAQQAVQQAVAPTSVMQPSTGAVVQVATAPAVLGQEATQPVAAPPAAPQAVQCLPPPPYGYPGYAYAYPLVEGQAPLLGPGALTPEVPQLAQLNGISLANFAQDTTPPTIPGSTDEAKKKELIQQGDQKIGQAPPPNNNTLQFLRRQTPLMPEGTWQFDIGFAYALYEFDTPLPIIDGSGDVIGVVEAQQTARLLTMPMELRYGVSDYIQAFLGMPVGYSDSEVSVLTIEDHEEVAGIGDTRFGVNAMLAQGCGYCPDVVGTIAGYAPTGDPGNPLVEGINPSARLGEGFFSIAASFLCIHQYDPIVLFYGLGYRHRFENTIDGVYYNPGEEVNYQLGVGFAVNPDVTLSTSFLGAYIGHWDANYVRIAGSELEPMRLRAAITVLRNDYIVEPFAEVGMSQDSPTGRIGITWTF